MKTVTLTEFRRNLESYLKDLETGSIGCIAITSYGKVLATVTSSSHNQLAITSRGELGAHTSHTSDAPQPTEDSLAPLDELLGTSVWDSKGD